MYTLEAEEGEEGEEEEEVERERERRERKNIGVPKKGEGSERGALLT